MAQPSPTDAWAESLPQATDAIADGDDEIRDLSRRIRERSNRGGHAWNEATLAEAGRHSLGHGSGSTGVGDLDGEFAIYAKDASTKIVRATDDDVAVAAADRNRFILDGTVIQGLRNINGIYESNIADGASAVAFALDNLTTLSTAGAKIMELLNNGTLKLSIDKDGHLVFATAAGKIIPGATSLSVRDNADSQDNLLVNDNGDVIVGNDIEAAGGFRQMIGGFVQDNVPADQAFVFIRRFVSGGPLYRSVVVTRAGSIVGIGIAATGITTAGTCTARAGINGLSGGALLSVAIDTTDPTFNSATQARDTASNIFAAGDTVGIQLETASYAPAGSVDIEAFLEIEF